MKKIALTFDDAVVNHYDHAMGLLRENNFGATFFICRFGDDWRKAHSEVLLSPEQIRGMARAGFEIGNHSWTHYGVDQVPESVFMADVDRMEAFLDGAGIPPRVSFAYPGGPWAEHLIEPLKQRGFRCARSVRNDYFRPGDDPFKLPCHAFQKDCLEEFKQFVDATPDGAVAVCLFHGVPDRVHPWVNTEKEVFSACMAHLRDIHADVRSLRDALGF